MVCKLDQVLKGVFHTCTEAAERCNSSKQKILPNLLTVPNFHRDTEVVLELRKKNRSGRITLLCGLERLAIRRCKTTKFCLHVKGSSSLYNLLICMIISLSSSWVVQIYESNDIWSWLKMKINSSRNWNW